MKDDLLLRNVEEKDLPLFFQHQLDPEAAAMAAFPSRDREAFMAHWKKIMADETNILKTVLYEGQVAGNIVSFLMEGDREVGYWIGKEYWGRGIATRALIAFLEMMRSRPLYGHVALHNTASLRVLQKCGFVIIGEEAEEYILELKA